MPERGHCYHCKINVVRQGADYGLNQVAISSGMQLFFDSSETLSFSVGGGNDDIQLKGVVPNYVFCSFGHGIASFNVCGSLEITVNNQGYSVKKPQKIDIPIDISKDVTWKMSFAKATIKGRIYAEEEILNQQAQAYLEAQYGEITKIREERFCLVYKTKEDRIVQVLRPSYGINKQIVRRFISAARKFQTFVDPRFLKINEVVYKRGHSLVYAVSPNFPGESLENHLARKGTLPIQEAESIVLAIAESLSFLEKHRCCCRNLAPDNIFLSKEGILTMTGFFLLKSEEIQLTGERDQMVIARYSSPEQVQHPKSVTILSDMFSLGALFHALLLGEPPLNSRTATEYLRSLLTGQMVQAEEIQSIAPQLPAKLCETIASLCAFDRTKRPGPAKFIAQMTHEPPAGKSSKAERIRALSHLAESSQETMMMTEEEHRMIFKEHQAVSPSIMALLERVDQEVSLPRKGEGRGYSLEIVSGPEGTRNVEYNFTGSHPVILGREGDLRITTDPRISRKHAKVEMVGGVCWVEDLKSQNGTYVNGQKITRAEIVPGMSFRLGNTTLQLQTTGTSIGGMLEDPDKELSDDDIGQLEELRILTLEMTPSVVPGRPSYGTIRMNQTDLPEEAKERMGIGKELDEEPMPSPELPKSPEMKPGHEIEIAFRKPAPRGGRKNIARKPSSTPQKSSRSRLVLSLVLLISVTLLSSIFLLGPKSKASSQEREENTTAGTQEKPPISTPTIQETTSAKPDSAILVKGKTTQIQYFNNRILYFWISTTTSPAEKYAVSFSSGFSQECARCLEMGQKDGMIVTIQGIYKKLEKGSLIDPQEKTAFNYIIKPVEIHIYGKIFSQ